MVLGKPGKGTKNSIVLGKPGKGTKVHIFTESNFKPELAPEKAKVKHIEIKGNNLVVMSY
ncbi:hypothetical protein CDB3_31550 [Bacillus sp. CDB3]|nr:hypothetical protein CDB3_31550 [Bacillus sp. CDB3]